MIGRKMLLRPTSKEHFEPQPSPLTRSNFSPVTDHSAD
jgi:hypothetical protein